jgi:4-hydroxy-3-polyprenylbenzoate decarboxylase
VSGRGDVKRRLVIAMSGASGLAYGVRLLEVVRGLEDVESHLIVSAGARAAVRHELDMTLQDIHRLADVVHSENNLSSALSSGSFATMGMIVAPCSVKTLSAIASSYSDNLVARAADVTLKERRRLIVMLRETPLHTGHIRLMAEATANGAIVYPPVPALYARPQSIDDMVAYTVDRVLDLMGIESSNEGRWHGLPDLENG